MRMNPKYRAARLAMSRFLRFWIQSLIPREQTQISESQDSESNACPPALGPWQADPNDTQQNRLWSKGENSRELENICPKLWKKITANSRITWQQSIKHYLQWFSRTRPDMNHLISLSGLTFFVLCGSYVELQIQCAWNTRYLSSFSPSTVPIHDWYPLW